MEHLHHFDLRLDPFSIEPDLRSYFDSPSHRDAQCRVERGLRQGKGLTVLTGESGTGKTLLARRVLNGLEEEVFEASLMVMLAGAAEAGPVLQRFARQLGVEDPGEDRGALMVQIYEMLATVREEGRHSVLILDDAQLLGPEHMAEIGGLLNLEYEDRRLLSLMLVGAPVLDESLLAAAGLEARVDVRVKLQVLDESNAAEYLAHRLAFAGGRPDILSAEAVAKLFHLGGGRPRMMNTLADNALFEAFLAKRAAVQGQDVERAARDLGLLPSVVDKAAAPVVSAAAAKPMSPQVAEVTMELTEGTHTVEEDDGLGDSVEDLGSLLSGTSSVPQEDDFSTLLVDDDFNGVGSTLDLDDEVEAVLNEAESVPNASPTFEADDANPPMMAEATRIALPEEGPPKDEVDDELDDLFVELIED